MLASLVGLLLAGVTDTIIMLPQPDTVGKVRVEQALLHRRSWRDYNSESLSLGQLGQVLWAAQGRTSASGGRTAPSAGATYPIEVFVVAGRVEGLTPAVYHYEGREHALRLARADDVRVRLSEAAFNQTCIQAAAFTLVLAADYARTAARYGERSTRYVDMEAGHVGQNVYLQCEALGLGTVAVGAFQDTLVKKLTGSSADPLYLMPVGRPGRE